MRDAENAARNASLGPDEPDEMGRELAEGPAAVDQTLAECERQAEALADAVASARRLVLIGTGASLAAARTAEPLLRAAATRGATGASPHVLVREASQAVLGAPDGDAFAAGDLVVAVSQSGCSPETLAAARLALASRARVVAVTAHETSPLATAADLVIWTPTGPEAGAATKTELAALAALLALAWAVPFDAASRAAIRAHLEVAVADVGGAMAAGRALARAGRAWIVGFGAGLGLAHAMATLLHEKALLAAVATTPSEFRHGPIEAATPDDVVALIEVGRPARQRTAYLERLAAELGQIGTPLLIAGIIPSVAGAITLPAGEIRLPAVAPGGGPEVEGSGEAVAILETLVRLQHAARIAAHARGTYRDGFRLLGAVVGAAHELAPG